MSGHVTPGGYTTRRILREDSLYPDYTGSEPCATSRINYWLHPHPAYQGTAKRLCQDCPLLAPCRDYAQAAREPSGVWGATTPDDRNSKL